MISDADKDRDLWNAIWAYIVARDARLALIRKPDADEKTKQDPEPETKP